MTFPQLSVRSSYSAHHGTTPPEVLVAAAAAHGADAAAITDRDGLYGAIRHIRACIEHGVDPIVGVELELGAGGAPARDAAARLALETERVTVLAHGHIDGEGWAGLCRLISAAHGNGRAHRRPQITRERMAAFLVGDGGPVGTVLLGPDSDVGRALARDDAAARTLAEAWRRELGDAVAIEVVCHFTEPGTARSLRHAARMLELADATGIPAVLTNAVRYLDPDEAVTADVLDAAALLTPLGAFPPQPNAQGWLKPPDDMTLLAHRIASASRLPSSAAEAMLRATREIADRCRLDPVHDVGWRQAKVPEASVLGIVGAPSEVLWRRCEAAVTERFPNVPRAGLDAIHRRMRDELLTIDRFGFATYFLTVADVTELIRGLGVRSNARGSGAGSLVNYLLRISNVDPVQHDLLFERFLGGQRSTLPDIDIDVESARRHDIYRAIFERYGSTRVTLLSMQSKYRARGAVRDAGLALGLPEHQIDLVAKHLWRCNAREFRAALAAKPELRDLAALVREGGEMDLLVDLTERLDRLPRHISMHPCGVILGPDSLLSVTPVQPSGLGLPMSQYDKDDIDDAGLLKLDVLGVRMQSSMAHALGEIERIHGARAAIAGGLPPDAPFVRPDGRIELDAIPLDDEATFEAIRSTHTLGMFQIESPGQRELIGKLQPTEFEDLIADISLFRPGPMKGNMVAPFLDVKHGFASPKYLHPRFRWFLEPTFGVVIYHEQVLRILADCMHISLGHADELRRSLDRPGADVEQRFRDRTARNVDEHGRRRFSDADIDRIWHVLVGFGSFGFCKAHGAAFALPTFQSAWLKTHFPAEFIAGLLTHDPGMYPRRLLLTEARRMGVPVLPLDVNASDLVYRAEPIREHAEADALASPRSTVGAIGVRLSLTDVAGASEAELARIAEHRPYDSIADFVARARPSRRLAERLAHVGALDSLAGTGTGGAIDPDTGVGRGDVIAHVRALTKRPRPPIDHGATLDFTVGAAIETGQAQPDAAERVRAELDVLAMELSEHVVESYRPMLEAMGVTPAGELLSLRGGTEVLVAGIRVATQTPPMRSGKRVVFISVDDGTGCADATFFQDAQERAGTLLFGTRMLLIAGRTRRSGTRGVSILAESAWDLTELWATWRTANPDRAGTNRPGRAAQDRRAS